MKTKELLKLNARYSIIEATYEKKATEYVVCSNYNPNGEEYRQWDGSVAYCISLEDAIKVAAKYCFEPMYMYVVVEFYCGDISSKTFNNYDDAYKYLQEKFNEYCSYEDCMYSDMSQDVADGNWIARVAYGEDSIDWKLIRIRVK